MPGSEALLELAAMGVSAYVRFNRLPQGRFDWPMRFAALLRTNPEDDGLVDAAVARLRGEDGLSSDGRD